MNAMSRKLLRATGIVLLLAHLAHTPAWGAGNEGANKVMVTGMRNPELKSYRIMRAGVEAFADYHALAPHADTVRFRLRARKVAGPNPYDGLSLRLVGEDTSVAIPLDAQATFTLPPPAAVADDDADLEVNKHQGGYNWMPLVRSAGVPDGTRRMGDLRLECQVLVAVVKKELGTIKTMLLDSLLLTTNWCAQKKIDDWNFPSFADRPLASAMLVTGSKRTALKIDSDPTVFTAPLADQSVSDDALVELKYADEANPARASAPLAHP
jgi:hypothetical protein